jgi:hypothetical protein
MVELLRGPQRATNWLHLQKKPARMTRTSALAAIQTSDRLETTKWTGSFNNSSLVRAFRGSSFPHYYDLFSGNGGVSHLETFTECAAQPGVELRSLPSYPPCFLLVEGVFPAVRRHAYSHDSVDVSFTPVKPLSI